MSPQRTHKHRSHRTQRAPAPRGIRLGAAALALGLWGFWRFAVSQGGILYGPLDIETVRLWLLSAATLGPVCAVTILRGFFPQRQLSLASVSVLVGAGAGFAVAGLSLFWAPETIPLFIALCAIPVFALALSLACALSAADKRALSLTPWALAGCAIAELFWQSLGQALAPVATATATLAPALTCKAMFARQGRGANTWAALGLATLGAVAVTIITHTTIGRRDDLKLRELVEAARAESGKTITPQTLPGVGSLGAAPSRWPGVADACQEQTPVALVADGSMRDLYFPVQSGADHSEALLHHVRYLAGQTLERPRICALDADAADVTAAAALDALEITAVWRSAGAQELFARLPEPESSSLYHLTAAPRAFISSSGRRYDLLLAPSPASQIADPGQPNIEHTVEAYSEYFAHLSDSGLLVYTLPDDNRTRLTLTRCLLSAEAALRERGAEWPEDHVLVLTSRPTAESVGDFTLAVVISPKPLSEGRYLRLRELAEADQFSVVTAPPDHGAHTRARRATLSPRETQQVASQHGVHLGPIHDSKPYPSALAQFRLDPVGAAIAGGVSAIQAVPVSARESLERLRTEARDAARSLFSSRLAPLILVLLILALTMRLSSSGGFDGLELGTTLAFVSAGAALGSAELILRPLGWPGALGPALLGAAALGSGVALAVPRVKLVGSLTVVIGCAVGGLCALELLLGNQAGSAAAPSLLAPLSVAALMAALGGASLVAVARRLTLGGSAGLTGMLALTAGFLLARTGGELLAPYVGHGALEIVAFGAVAASAGILMLELIHSRNRSAPLRNHGR